MPATRGPIRCSILYDALEPLRRRFGLDCTGIMDLDGAAFTAALLELPPAERTVVESGMWEAMRRACSAAAEPGGAAGSDAVSRRLHRAQRMEAMGLLAGVVAHEFNNHLLTISGFTDLVLRTLPPDDPSAKKLHEVRSAAEQAGVLTRQLQSMALRRRADPTRIDLGELCRELEPLLGRLAGRHVELRVATESLPLRVDADRSLLEQVLVTLVGRAREVMPKGGRLTLEVGAVAVTEVGGGAEREVAPGRYVVCSVTDTGPGMNAEERLRAFEPFVTGDGGFGGGSLELSTAYGIAAQCGGLITVYSEVESGTTFRLFLPDAGSAGGERPGAPPAQPGALGRPGQDRLVLLVEDEDSIRTLARLVLQQAGYRVVEARDGGEALLLAEKSREPIHLLLTDISLPRITGRELFERLRPIQADLRVLFTSGYTHNAIVRPGESPDDFAFLPKPYTPVMLVAAVGEALARAA